MTFVIQIFNGDVGGIDEDYESDTLAEAVQIAEDTTQSGTRGTDIYEVTGDVWVQVGFQS
jgi:hypothetical protein